MALLAWMQTDAPGNTYAKYLVVCEKVRNDWKLAADIWNDGK